MANTEWVHLPNNTGFILSGLEKFNEFQSLFVLIFLVVYIVTMAGNILIVVLVILDHHFHTPMYFFLWNLSFLEACCCNNILPKMLAGLLAGDTMISHTSCLTQWYFFGCLGGTECYLLSVMSYDRYLAICKPLHYVTLMNPKTCIYLAVASWLNGFIEISILLVFMTQLVFCGPTKIDHFFCETLTLIKLSCNNKRSVEIMSFILAVIFTLPPFLLTLTSYVCIIAAILKIPSTTGRKKAFSTCSSHLIVVSIFYGSIMFVYMLPKTEALRGLDKVFSLLYTALPPLVNPYIYSLRNKEVKEALRKMLVRFVVDKVY
ncbi:olfactory receptor 11A1-like [Hemicordylus capensis]|uniref:olfactory receptor 11A1-like n=1 Tax=Hemicordylus capensis TaxID=884348 RepID=UPI00230369ED|nr:olfactory receptor 11A1-like [Hemicordylus capensis]